MGNVALGIIFFPCVERLFQFLGAGADKLHLHKVVQLINRRAGILNILYFNTERDDLEFKRYVPVKLRIHTNAFDVNSLLCKPCVYLAHGTLVVGQWAKMEYLG